MREEEREGLKKRGLITFSWKKKGGGGGEDVIEKGGFVGYLSYLTKFEPLDSKFLFKILPDAENPWEARGWPEDDPWNILYVRVLLMLL